MGLVAGILHGLHASTTVVIPAVFEPRAVRRLMAETATTVVFGVPFHFDLLSRLPEEPSSPQRLRLAVSAGEIMPQAVFDRFRQRYGIPISPVYGMTEVGIITESLTHEQSPPSVGFPAPGIEVGVDGGELFVHLTRSPYLSGDDGSRFVDGRLRTFDRCRRNPDGSISILGRADSVATIGGLKVDLIEVENVLSSHPMVREAVVLYETTIEAFLGCAEELSAAEIAAWCRERLSDYKIPKRFHLRPAVPRTATGKLVRHRGLLQAAYTAPEASDA
jgi:acyl-coenzyme A synthetase/AMP-(fatty) acid ligase